MTIDADTIQTVLTGAFGACAVLFGNKGIRWMRNGQARNAAFEAERSVRPGYADKCIDHGDRLSALEADTDAE